MTIAFIAFGVFIIFQSAEYWQRVYAAKNQAVVGRGLIWSAVLVVVTGIAITVVGLAAHHSAPGLEARDAFSYGLRTLMPEKLIGTGLVLIFAAIMSSADTIIFVLASSMAKDFHSSFSRTESDPKRMVKLTRLFILILSVCGFGLAWFFRDLIAVIVFITGMGFTIIPAAVASFHTRLPKQAVLASFLAGILYIFILFLAGYLVPEASIASILVSALTLIIATQIYKGKQDNTTSL
jgi:SSS family solute:Na+ symporter